MASPTANATVLVAPGSAAITWEVATILSEALSQLGLRTSLGDPDIPASGVPIVIFGQGATVSTPVSAAQARRAVVLLLAGPGTPAFNAAVELAEVAAGCFVVSPHAVAALRLRGIRVERFVLGYAAQWDARAADNRTKSIDLVYTGETDGSSRRVLARLAPELAEIQSHVGISVQRPVSPVDPPSFESNALLSDSRLTLSLNRWGDTTLDWAIAVRAMCNRSVVIAENAVGAGELVPGKHLLMTRAESIEPVVRAAVADPQAIEEMAVVAYEFCRKELAMSASVERLAAAIPSRVHLRLPTRGRQPLAASRTPRVRTDSRLEFRTASSGDNDLAADTEVDVICVEHDGSGPLSLTRESLVGQRVRVNLHTGVAGHRRTPPPMQSSFDGSVAEIRNALVRRSKAPFVMFVDSGDEVLGGALRRLVAALDDSGGSDICVPIVALRSDDLVYPPFRDSPQEPGRKDVPVRGYVLRRSYLDRVGSFRDGDEGQAGVDQAFWKRVELVGGRAALLPQVGVRLWQQT